MDHQNLAPNETMQIHEMLNLKTLTETNSPEIRATLKKHLNDAIATHEKISNYMAEKVITMLMIYMNSMRSI